MIIACERCETRFQLDDERIPERGARVRCSKCKHTFFAQRAQTPDDAIHALAAEAAATGEVSTPEVTEDLNAETRPDFGRDFNPEAAAPSGESEEQDWQFNLDPEEEEPAFDRADATATAPSFLDDLGSPESWDLVGESAELAQTDAVESAASLEDALGDWEEDASPREVEEAEEQVGHARGPLLSSEGVRVPGRGRPVAVAGAMASWFAVTAIALFAFWQALPIAGGLDLLGGFRTAAVAPPQFRFGDLAIDRVSAARSENLWSGPTLIVAAELRNDAGGGASLDGVLRAEVVDALGTVVASAAMSRTDSSDLRQVSPVAYGNHVERGALDLGRRVLRPSEKVAVRAMFHAGLPDAVGVRFSLDALPPAAPDLEAVLESPQLDEQLDERGDEGAGGGSDEPAEDAPSAA
ncbi:MAG: hypothetical protein HKP27_10015 [Myxococcales bacterium]|nr:hypothetical protein [Myxococcales bacterium]